MLLHEDVYIVEECDGDVWQPVELVHQARNIDDAMMLVAQGLFNCNGWCKHYQQRDAVHLRVVQYKRERVVGEFSWATWEERQAVEEGCALKRGAPFY